MNKLKQALGYTLYKWENGVLKEVESPRAISLEECLEELLKERDNQMRILSIQQLGEKQENSVVNILPKGNKNNPPLQNRVRIILVTYCKPKNNVLLCLW